MPPPIRPTLKGSLHLRAVHTVAAAGIFQTIESKAPFCSIIEEGLLYALLSDPDPFSFFSPGTMLSKRGRAYSVSRQCPENGRDRDSVTRRILLSMTELHRLRPGYKPGDLQVI